MQKPKLSNPTVVVYIRPSPPLGTMFHKNGVVEKLTDEYRFIVQLQPVLISLRHLVLGARRHMLIQSRLLNLFEPLKPKKSLFCQPATWTDGSLFKQIV